MDYDYKPCKDGFIVNVRATNDFEKQRCVENAEQATRTAWLFLLHGIFPDLDIFGELIRQHYTKRDGKEEACGAD